MGGLFWNVLFWLGTGGFWSPRKSHTEAARKRALNGGRARGTEALPQAPRLNFDHSCAVEQIYFCQSRKLDFPTEYQSRWQSAKRPKMHTVNHTVASPTAQCP
jgi:hypothetical protein